MPSGTHPALIRGLCDPAVYPHEVDEVRVLQTHISYVLLAGPFAYKIKKPVDLGFVDFSTLEKREFYCREELRLNRKLAPEIYLEVVALYGEPGEPRFENGAAPIEYAVKMRRFPQQAQLDRKLERGELDVRILDTAARTIAEFHGRAAVLGPDAPYGGPEQIMAPVRGNFTQLLPLVEHADTRRALLALAAWFEDRYVRLRGEFLRRKSLGLIREVHGDLHLSNLIALDGKVVPFDCIEFDPALRSIDVMSDSGFLMMDLLVRRRDDLAYRYINAYLQTSGDYAGLKVLGFYLVYLSLVRAKVAAMRRAQVQDAAERGSATRRCRDHLALALNLSRGCTPMLVIAHGLSGSGKSWLIQRLAPVLRGIWLRSDVERKRLAGLAADSDSGSAVGSGLYSESRSRQTYQRLAELAESVIEAGYTVLVDAAFLKREQRRRFADLAVRCRVGFAVLHCHAGADCLRARVARRSAEGEDASEADIAVLEHQLVNAEAIDATEHAQVVRVDTESAPDLQRTAQRLKRAARC